MMFEFDSYSDYLMGEIMTAPTVLRGLESVVFLLCILSLPVISSSYDIPTHQHITTEAGKVWGDTPSELKTHLDGGAAIDFLCVANYDIGDDIVTGSGDEDQESFPFL